MITMKSGKVKEVYGSKAKEKRFTNQRSNGDHTFVIHGPDFRQQYTFPDSPAIKIIREDTLKICSRVDAKGNPIAYPFL